MKNNNLIITPSELGEFISKGNCPRYAKLRSQGNEEEKARDWKEAFNNLNPLLSETGRQFEKQIYEKIQSEAQEVVTNWKEFSQQEDNDAKICKSVLKTAKRKDGGSPLVLFQPRFVGKIGAFSVPGDADLVIMWPEKDNHVHIRVFDIKSSFDEKTYHQIQTSCYTILLEKILNDYEFESDLTFEIDGGIIYRESDWGSVEKEQLPFFEPTSREKDVKRLLKNNGELYNIFNAKLSNVNYQLDSNCESCPFNEACFTRSIESQDIRLLGLTRGEQESFRQVGLSSLSDIAELIEPVDDLRPYEYDTIEIRDEYSTIKKELKEDHSITHSLPLLAQKAQSMLGQTNPEHPYAYTDEWMNWIQGSGDGTLPEDDPPFDMEMDIERGSMIRVYINVQWDYIRDRIAVMSGRVTSTEYSGKPLEFGEIMTQNSVKNDERKQSEDEKRLLKKSLKQLLEQIERIGSQNGREDAPIHFYFYSEQERDKLMEGVKRHSNVTEIDAMRDLLSHRKSIDQQMVSYLKSEISSRMTRKSIIEGLIPTIENIYPPNAKKMDWEDWKYEDKNGEIVNLRDIFYNKIFDYKVGYNQSGENVSLLLSPEEKEKKGTDGYVSLRGRFGAEIPLEYIWAAKGIDELTPQWTEDPQYKSIIELYQWHDSDVKNKRITRNDVLQLSKKFAQALEHIERGIKFKNKDITKNSLKLSEINNYSLGDTSLAVSCKDYLDLEYESSNKEIDTIYRKPVRERILEGKSIPVKVKSFEYDDGFLTAKCSLIVDEFDFKNPTEIAMSSSITGSDTGSGSWMVATPLRELSNGDIVQSVGKPNQIKNSTPVTVSLFNPQKNTLEIQSFPNGGKSSHSYRTWHKRWVTEEGNGTLIEEGSIFILDPQADDMTSEKCRNALDNSNKSSVYQTMTDMLNNRTTNSKIDLFDSNSIDEYITYCEDDSIPSPNTKQKEFISEIDSKISLLQGPPGTGKTSGALSHAIVARAFSFSKQDKHLRGLISGASNKSVDELLEDVSHNLKQFENKYKTDDLDNVLLVRLTNEKPEKPLDNVKYVNYYEDEEYMREIERRLNPPDNIQTTLTDTSLPHILIFSTPSRVSGLMNNHSQFEDTDPYNLSPGVFDLFAADEGSMLPLPQFFLSTAFMTDDGQLLIGGDQRQMPPVQKHDWEEEDRRTIEEFVPYLSTLDYFRYLKGEEISILPKEKRVNSSYNIPLTKLNQTYRCHTEIANFLQRWVYSQDEIEFHSNVTHTIPSVTADTEGVNCAIDNTDPLTLVLHNDSTSQQSNHAEAKIAQKLVSAIPESESIGIVTPHNSQKGLISSICDSRAHVDTVERFQGGQRDVMILSTTVSDPDYLDAESDFILNLNRLNVALSRMKKKLIVIAPHSLFSILPTDIDKYEESLIWRGLYSEVNADEPPKWAGTLQDFTSDSDDSEVKMEIHNKQ